MRNKNNHTSAVLFIRTALWLKPPSPVPVYAEYNILEPCALCVLPGAISVTVTEPVSAYIKMTRTVSSLL